MTAPSYREGCLILKHVLTPCLIVVATAIVTLNLTWFSVVLRGYVRAILVKSFQMDDWMLLVAQVRHCRVQPRCYDRDNMLICVTS